MYASLITRIGKSAKERREDKSNKEKACESRSKPLPRMTK